MTTEPITAEAPAGGRPVEQRPDWPHQALTAAVRELTGRPTLVTPRDCDALRHRLGAVARGEAFLLQGGDCAEIFDDLTAARTEAQLTTLSAMAATLGGALTLPVVTVGRIAGQYAKPRSSPTETRDGRTLPAYRGDTVNDRRFTAEDRAPDPRRLLRAYNASAATLATVRALGARDPRLFGQFHTSHEALLLDYESALIRTDRLTGHDYGLSGHLLWIGERTRRTDGAHVAFAARIRNPVAVKLGPSTTPDDLLALIDRLDPDREPGRLSFITRMGAGRIRDLLPPLVEKTAATGARIAWICDPMHGNTSSMPDGRKTRRFDDVLDEIAGFFEVHRALGTHLGGIHLELTGQDVTECLGGAPPLVPADLDRRYESACDPRLNRAQALELAARVAKFVHGG